MNYDMIGKYTYILAIWTDRADFVSELTEPEKLLEVRAFGEEGEYRAWRSCVDEEFQCRELRDDSLPTELDGWFDESQYLDIDAKRTSGTLAFAIGAGSYHLPEAAIGNELLKIRYYYRYDGDGIARKADWRLVGFAQKEDAKWTK